MKELKRRLAWTAGLFLAVIGIVWMSPDLAARAATVTGEEWTTPEQVRVNQTDARALVIPFDDVESAKENPTLRLSKESPNYIDLDGTWKFYWVSKPSEKPNVEGVTTIPDYYYDITVPSSWQTNMQYAGWMGTQIDWPIYNNQDYPWEAKGNGVSAQSKGNGSAAPKDYNPVGTYMRTVNIKKEDLGNRFILTFLGVESGFYLYVNGEVVGYDEDSFTTGEFDITEYLHEGENLITAQVYHYTTGSYLENQDMVYYAGIHRDVYITMQPKVSIYDYNVETTFENHNYNTGNLSLDVDVTNVSEADAGNYRVKAYLYDDEGKAVSVMNGQEAVVSPAAGGKATARFQVSVPSPKLWSAEFPNLYTLVMELCDENGETLQAVGKRIGFKEFYIEGTGKKSEMRINGQNIEFYGVNRGEADPKGGHYVPYETIVKDVQNAKQLNINAIRTSHFPPDPNLIELADEYGLYIMDEVNVESHNARTMSIPSSAKYENTSGRLFPGNDKRYTNAMVDRMTSLVMRDKNNASVLIYSLGNEAGSDASDRQAPDPQEGNFNRMIDVIKALDSEKLIHYQGWVENSRVDIDGSMYPNYPTSDAGDKPSIMMEYQHSMGNAGGDFEKYTNAFEAQARRQGGFIWDYIDQSAYTPKDGKGGEGLTSDDLYFGFDGSWKQDSGDLNFCVNGFIFPDRTWSPQAYDIKYWYQDLKFAQTEEQKAEKKVTLRNLNRFKNANYYEITWSLLEDGEEIQTGTFTDEEVDLAPPTGSIAAASTKELTVPYEIKEPKEGAEYLLQLTYKLKTDTVYAKKGYVHGSGQFTLPEEVRGVDKTVELSELPDVKTSNTEKEVTVTGTTQEGQDFTVKVNKETGLMTTYQVDGKDLISRAPTGSFFRGETDQNAAINGTNWTTKGEAYDGWYEQGENMTDVSVEVSSLVPQMTKVSVSAKLQNGSDYATSYSIYGNATIVVTAKLTPSDSAPAQLGEYGMWMQVPEEYENLTWYGRGPSESYWNRKEGSMIGLWGDTTVTEQFVPYLRLQENGNKTDVRWIALQNDEGEGLLASMTYGAGYTGDALEAVALHYAPSALSTHRSGDIYPWQAESTKDVCLRLLTHQKGMGNRTWSTEPEYAVINKNDTELLDYTYTLMPLSADTDPMEKSKEIMGELPEIPAITSISVGDQVLSGFQSDKTEYTVELPTGFTGLPKVEAKGPSTLDIAYRQVTQLPGTAVVTVKYEDQETGIQSSVEYQIHFQMGGEMVQQLSDLAVLPEMTADTPVIRPENSKLLYAYSGYNAIFQNQNQSGHTLTTGPAEAQSFYDTGFAGNTEQILDFDISGSNAQTFSGVGGIDWDLKAGNNKSTIQFEVWAHKDVSVLTKEYYENPENIDPGIASRGTADWTASGWVKLADSGQITGTDKDPKYTFADIPLTYEEQGATKSYQAIRLVMDVSNGSNGHDQGVWGNPRILTKPDQHPGSGLEKPGEDSMVLSVNGVALEGFQPDQKEYEVTLNYGAALPKVEARVTENGAEIPVKISKITELPGTVTVSYDNGAPVSYAIHFTRDQAITGASAYLSDVADIPSFTGPGAVRNGNLLYAYSGAGSIYTDRSEGSGQDTKLQLRERGKKTADADDTVIRTYDHGFAGRANQIIDLDISSQKAGSFQADVGIDWAMKPDTGNETADAPTVQFEVWAHKSVSQLDYSQTNPSPDKSTDLESAGWVKLAVSPVMSNWDYSGDLEVERDLYTFHVDLTYLEGRETKSYEALRLVMNPVDGSAGADQGIWADPVVNFIGEEESLMSLPVLDDAKTEVTADGVSVPVLLENIDTSKNTSFHVLLTAYDAENRMVGYTMRSYNAKDTGGNIDETVTVNYDTTAVPDATLAFLTWYGDEPFAPVFGAFTRGESGKFTYGKLPFVNQISENPQVSLSVDAEADTVTVTGSGFQPNSDLTLQGIYEKTGEPDHAAQVTCSSDGTFRYTYTSNYDLEEDSFLDVTVGGQGLKESVTATTKTSPDQGRTPVTNTPKAATWNDRVIDLSLVEGLFAIDENAGTARYTIEAGGTGEGTIGGDEKTLTVTRPGTIRIGLVTSQTETHASGAKVIAVLTVNNNSDRAALRRVMALAETKEESDYTAESFANLRTALAAAEVTADKELAAQTEIDDAAFALFQAVLGLTGTGDQNPADSEALETVIALAEAREWSDYTAESWAEVQTALSAAQETAAREDATEEEIAEAVQKLTDALAKLELQLESTYVQDFNAAAELPEGWQGLEYTSGNLAVKDVSEAPAGYPESVTGNAINAQGSGSGTRGARVAYAEKSVPGQAVFGFDFYIKPVSKSVPNLLYLEQGDPIKPENSAEVKETANSFFALADGMTKDKTLQYYNYDTKAWVDIPGGSGKWLHAEVTADFAKSKVSFVIKDGDTVLAEITQENALTFSAAVTTFNRMTLACYRGSGNTDCNIWMDNFSITGIFPTEAVKVMQVTPDTEAITVRKGTSLDEVKAELARITLTAEAENGTTPGLSNSASIWEVEGYDAQTPDTYTATAAIELPAGYAWADGAVQTVSVTVTVEDTVLPADKTALREAIALAESKEEALYTPESWNNLTAALETAREAEARDDISQEEVNQAAAQLNEAVEALVEIPVETVNKAVLRAAITLAESKEEADYTPDTWTSLQTALAAAKEAEGSEEADQSRVDEAAKALIEAVTALQAAEPEIPEADRDVLAAVITLAESKEETDYTEESWSSLQTALTNAKEILADEGADQAGIDQAAIELLGAVNGLEVLEPEAPKPERAVLTAAITLAESKEEADYTAESWTKLQAALDKAREVQENQEAAQEEIDEAAISLMSAVSGLEPKAPEAPQVGRDVLNAAIAQAEAKVGTDYTAESWTKLQTALQKAVAAASDQQATQSQIDQAAIELLSAISGLKEKETAPQVIPTASVSFSSRKDVKLNGKGTVTRKAAVSPANATDQKVTYTSSDPKVASVDPNTGKVTAKAPGAAEIVASCEGKTDSYRVLVKPGKVKLASVKSASSRKVTVRWKKTAGASGYEIQIGDSPKKMKKAKPIKVTKGSAVKKVLAKYANGKKLKGGKKLYIRMRAYKKTGSEVIYGAYSSRKACRIKK